MFFTFDANVNWQKRRCIYKYNTKLPLQLFVDINMYSQKTWTNSTVYMRGINKVFITNDFKMYDNKEFAKQTFLAYWNDQ